MSAYDVFLSYRHREPDQSWVRNTLKPALSAAGVKVLIDEQAFQLGAPVLLEMERAVVESRFTLAVMTPQYLDSNFTQLETVLAETHGFEESEHRLLAVLREPCDPPLRMRAREYFDMTYDAAFDAELAKLVAAIGARVGTDPTRQQPPPQPSDHHPPRV